MSSCPFCVESSHGNFIKNDNQLHLRRFLFGSLFARILTTSLAYIYVWTQSMETIVTWRKSTKTFSHDTKKVETYRNNYSLIITFEDWGSFISLNMLCFIHFPLQLRGNIQFEFLWVLHTEALETSNLFVLKDEPAAIWMDIDGLHGIWGQKIVPRGWCFRLWRPLGHLQAFSFVDIQMIPRSTDWDILKYNFCHPSANCFHMFF